MGGGRTGGGSQGPGEACGPGALGHICRAGGLGGGCQSKAGQRREGGAPLAGQFRPPAGGTSSPSGSSAIAFLVVSNVTVCGTHGRPRAPSRSDISSSGTHSLRYASEFNTFLAERMYRFIKSELTAPNNRSAGTEAMWTVVQRAGLMKRAWKTSDIYIVACWNSICRAPGPAPRIPHRQLRGAGPGGRVRTACSLGTLQLPRGVCRHFLWISHSQMSGYARLIPICGKGS